MSATKWTVTYRIRRQKGHEPPRVDQFSIDMDPEEYVLDGVERIWAFHDRSLTFRHACHHSTCGACGMRVNGIEKLTCITRIRDVTTDGGVIVVEPLRNFPVLSDLVVDMSALYLYMEQVDFRTVTPIESTADPGDGNGSLRLVDCIECGLCFSACPVMATALNYVGPAALAAAHHDGLHRDPALLDRLDSDAGIWRCHNTFECSAVCPCDVDPARRIMHLRRQVVGQRLKRLFSREKEATR